MSGGTEIHEQAGYLGFTCDDIKTKYGTGIVRMGEYATVHHHESILIEYLHMCHAESRTTPAMVFPTIILGRDRCDVRLGLYYPTELAGKIIQIVDKVHRKHAWSNRMLD